MLKYDINRDVPVSSFEVKMEKYINDNISKSTGLYIENYLFKFYYKYEENLILILMVL